MSALPCPHEIASPAPEGARAIVLRHEEGGDDAAREALLDAAMGPGRRRKSSEAIRRGRLPAEALSFVASDGNGALVGTVRLWNVAAGEADDAPVPALLLGPLAVSPDLAGRGIGGALMRRAVAAAGARGHGAILLVGDAPYYGRFGFGAEATGGLAMPGPFEPHRLLALELSPGFLDGARGLIRATGRRSPGNAAAAPAPFAAVVA